MPYLVFIVIFISTQLLAGASFQTGSKANTLLELYTSEGCSSCPPADKWLGKLKDKPELFSRVVPLAFHVDYWDNLGWKDEYAKSEFSKRQRRHNWFGNISSVYTPGVIKNGKEFRRWHYGFNLNHQETVVGQLKGQIDEDLLSVVFDNQTQYKDLVLNTALLGVGVISKVGSGENSGRTLTHDFVVLNHQRHVSKQDSKRLDWQVPIPKSSHSAPRYALAIWVSTINYRPIQATGVWLN